MLFHSSSDFARQFSKPFRTQRSDRQTDGLPQHNRTHTHEQVGVGVCMCACRVWESCDDCAFPKTVPVSARDSLLQCVCECYSVCVCVCVSNYLGDQKICCHSVVQKSICLCFVFKIDTFQCDSLFVEVFRCVFCLSSSCFHSLPRAFVCFVRCSYELL